MIRTEYSISLSSRSYVCFLIFSHSTFDVGRSMFDVHLFHSLLGKSNLALIPANPLCNVYPHQPRNEDGEVKLAHDSLKQSQ